MARTVHVQYHLKDKSQAWWTENNPVLGPAEPGVEIDTGRFKLGDGHTRWNDLNYFVPVNPGGASDPELDAHITSENPHQNFFNTEGVSLLVRYRNAKV